jgi:hypothetical protein
MGVAQRLRKRRGRSERPIGWNRPARQIGGDDFDLRDLENGQWCLVVGDVTGKGMPAAHTNQLVYLNAGHNPGLAHRQPLRPGNGGDIDRCALGA